MTSHVPDRPSLPDDLDQAYAQAHALTDDGREPAASVRANVLAAALQVAASAARSAAVEPEAMPTLTPVAAPVSDVARGRTWALNLSSWRMRSGAALGAALIVALGAWRFDANHHLDAGTQVAVLESRAVEANVLNAPPADLPPPKNLPMPSRAPMAAPPAQVELAAAPAEAPAGAKASARDKDLVVAQAEQPYRANSPPPPRADTFADARGQSLAKAAPPVYRSEPEPTVVIAGAAPPAPALGAVAPPHLGFSAPAPAPAAPVFAANAAAAPPPPAATAERRVVLAAPPAPVAAPPAAAASQSANTVVAVADTPQRVEVTGGATGGSFSSDAARGSLGRAKKAAPAPADKLIAASLAALPTPLHAAAANGDVDTLQKLLANPATRVDVVDAQGRTPLMLAVAGQHVGAVRALLAAGADPDRADPGGATPRSLARTGANAEIAALFAAPH